MTDVVLVRNLVTDYLRDTDYELVDVSVSKDNNIVVEIDRLRGVDVDFCGELNRYLVDKLGDEDDYSLEVGSVSLTAPFKTRMQYEKHLGENVEVLTAEGKKLRGQLVSVDENTFSVDIEQMVAVEGKKRKQKQIETFTWTYDGVKSVKYVFAF